ncbi:hypothetical protein Mth01_08380 [Sphaerimonospora thailandensis]|uniref:Uncharacterized protein n=1 Tax=Sphaerimonospora thailandensis TaxID=795644 RepID=A0A8J3VY43_9ACTN|nr:hypothetical protein Mth01_08380 [Sphaerimonospora thailandensis]
MITRNPTLPVPPGAASAQAGARERTAPAAQAYRDAARHAISGPERCHLTARAARLAAPEENAALSSESG